MYIYLLLLLLLTSVVSKQKASFLIDCNEGLASINLSCNLGYPGASNFKPQKVKTKKTPSRTRRDNSRAARFQNSARHQKQQHHQQSVYQDVSSHLSRSVSSSPNQRNQPPALSSICPPPLITIKVKT